MPFRPSLRSTWTLLILAAACYGLYVWCESSHIEVKRSRYVEKIAAANRMDQALRLYQNVVAEKGVFSEQYKDPRLEAVIGQQFSVITTEMGSFETKVISANPNFAAIAVELLNAAGVGDGDLVAVDFTGSYPGANTAILCACEALGATAVTITAIGASWWGATDPEFTWVDMEYVLNRDGLIQSQPIAASYGGINDNAVGLSGVGKDAMRTAVDRHGLKLLSENDLPAAAARRFRSFQDAAGGRKYAAYVTVGRGIASLGHAANGRLIRNGLNRKLPVQNYPARGVIHLFNSSNVPIINFHDIAALSREYGLGGASDPLPDVGHGDVFITERYDLRIAGISAVLAALIILILVKFDSRLFRLREAGVDPDTLM